MCATSTLEGQEGQTCFRVVDDPSYISLDFDGLVGWWGMRGNTMNIDAASHKIIFLEKVPEGVAQWSRFGIMTNSDTLKLEFSLGGTTNGILYVDTGADMGIALSHQMWQTWKAAHPHQPMTLNSYYTLAEGLVATEEAWADRFRFGSLELTDVPITEEMEIAQPTNGYFQGTLGMAALKRLDCIIDGEHGLAYLRPKNARPSAYYHNRLGAMFLPGARQGDKLVARVMAGSPAEEAGVRDGDVLLYVDGLKVTGWDPGALRPFWLPAGTKVKLTLQRDQKIFETTATLRDILHPQNAESVSH